MGGSAFSGTPPGIGSAGGVGFLSPTDQNAVASVVGPGTVAMGNRYAQLGLGQTGATPGGSPGNFGAGSTPFQMDIGAAPSLTGGIPAEAQATLGDIQSSDLGSTAASAGAAIQGKGQQVGGLTNLGTGIAGLFGL